MAQQQSNQNNQKNVVKNTDVNNKAPQKFGQQQQNVGNPKNLGAKKDLDLDEDMDDSEAISREDDDGGNIETGGSKNWKTDSAKSGNKKH
jgi:hypothetical protein